jgi:hypothetical protein
MHPLKPLWPALFLFALTAPTPRVAVGEDSAAAPVFPAGSAIAGQTLFVEKGCYQCHHAGEVELPVADLGETLIIPLGKDEQAGWTRDDYARAILDPEHTIADRYRKIMTILGERLKAEASPMPSYVDLLSVGDLVHLVTFLESLGEGAAR